MKKCIKSNKNTVYNIHRILPDREKDTRMQRI